VKKFFKILFLGFLVLGFVGCSDSNDSISDKEIIDTFKSLELSKQETDNRLQYTRKRIDETIKYFESDGKSKQEAVEHLRKQLQDTKKAIEDEIKYYQSKGLSKKEAAESTKQSW